MLETIVIAAARDRVEAAARGALAHHPIYGEDGILAEEPRVAPIRHRLGQALRRLSDRLDPMPSARPTPAPDAR
jgi:hypothetical protein